MEAQSKPWSLHDMVNDCSAPPSMACDPSNDLLDFLNDQPDVADAFDISTLVCSQSAKDLLCIKQETGVDTNASMSISFDGFDGLLSGSLGSVAMGDSFGDLLGASSDAPKTMTTEEITKDERMGYVFKMLMDNIMGSTLSETSQFGHAGESGMVDDFEGRISGKRPSAGTITVP